MTVKPAGRAPGFIAVYSLILALSTIFIGLRLYTRAVIVKNVGIDDWFASISYALLVVFYACAISGAFHGTGQHAWDIKPPTELPIALKWWWACEPVYVLCSMALKLSIAFMLLRLTVIKAHRYIIYFTTAVVQIYSAFFFFLFVLQCRPSAYFWTRYTGGKGSCIDTSIIVNATYGYSVICCIGDWTLAILPIFMVWNLQMNKSTKLSVAGILAMGAIASTATIVRFPYVSTLSNQEDFLYATVDVAIWSICETGLGLMACSVATLRPLIRLVFANSKFLGSTGAKQSSGWRSHGGTGGYLRSNTAGEQYGLRDDIGTKRGVTTHVQAGHEADLESGRKTSGGVSISDSEKKLKGATKWGNQSDDDWETGIRKTTVSNQTVTGI